MAVTPVVVAPFTMKDVSLIFGPELGEQFEFRTQVDSVSFEPSSSTVEWKGLGNNSYTGSTTPTWVCALSYAQDWDSPASLSRYLYENDGTTVDVVFKPKNMGTAEWTGQLIIVPGAVGGAVDAVAVATVSLGMPAKPVLVAA